MSVGAQEDEPTTILLAGSGGMDDEPTTIVISDDQPDARQVEDVAGQMPDAIPAGETDDVLARQLRPVVGLSTAGGSMLPVYGDDEATTVALSLPVAPPEWCAPIMPASPVPSPFISAGPILPDYGDEEATTVAPSTLATREAAYVTQLMPTPAASDAAGAGQPWFDTHLNAFIAALRQDEHGQARPPEARQALAAAARDTIARVAMQGAAAAPWADDTVLQPNQLLANTYIVRALIARGGVGEIFRARHRDLRTEHAIKILLPRHALDPTMLTLMLEEARLLQCVRHDAVVGCQDLLRDTDGRPMLVMDYVRGRTLSNHLRDGRVQDASLLALTHRLASGLAAIHDAGIVHGDVSPDNIILSEDSYAAATIIDFGLARRHVDTSNTRDPRNTETARDVHGLLDFAGKFSWSSPEQLSGRRVTVDARSDLYSLGLMLAAAARGYRLEMGHDLETARAARSTIPSLVGIAQPMAGLLERLLAPDPADRLASARDIAALLKPPPRSFFKRVFIPGKP